MTVAQAKSSSSLSSRKTRLLHKIDRKLYAMSTRNQREPMLHLAEARCFAWLCGQPWAQRRYWPGKVAVIERFLHATELLTHNPTLCLDQVIQQALFCDAFFSYWRNRLYSLHPQQLAQVITVRGEETWRSCYQQGKGVILLQYHTLAGRLALPWLTNTGVKPFLSIDTGRKVAAAAGLTASPGMTPFLHTRQLHAARSCLAEGGVVRIAADGFQGSGGITLPLYGRARLFRTAFAELALLTGAVVTPVSALLDRHGKVEITFHPPLKAGEEQQNRSERVEALVQQYVAFLHTAWATAPGNIGIEHMARFLQQSTPIIAEGTNNRVH